MYGVVVDMLLVDVWRCGGDVTGRKLFYFFSKFTYPSRDLLPRKNIFKPFKIYAEHVVRSCIPSYILLTFCHNSFSLQAPQHKETF